MTFFSNANNNSTPQLILTQNILFKEEIKEKVKYILETLRNKNLLNLVLRSSVFDTLPINWEIVNASKSKDNIFNTYIKMTKLIRTHTVKQSTNEKYSRNNHLLTLEYIVYLKYTTYQIEMLFVLSTLLGGKRKAEVQDVLSSLNIIDIVSNYIDFIDWGNIHADTNRQSFDTIPEANLLDENAYHVSFKNYLGSRL